MEVLPVLNVMLGLLSLAGLSLFLARFLKRSSALMPMVAVALAMLWFTVLGCAGLLVAAGWLWYALCLAALGFVLVREKGNIIKLCTPGFWFFLLGGAVFVLLFLATQPMFAEWDDFTFWGTAAKAAFENGELYTTATSNLLARSYPPGLIVFTYMAQFFGGQFTEYGMMAAYSFIYLAAFSAASALWENNRAAAVAFACGLFLLPFFFEPGAHLGDPSWAYLTVMADLPLAAMFGGTLCFYFAGGERDWRLLLPFGILLGALTNVKDMGFALALLALLVAGADLFFCERDRLSFGRMKGWAGGLVSCGICLVFIIFTYLLWAVHLAQLPTGVDRFNLGSAGQTLGMGSMLLTAVGAFFGLVSHPQYSQVFPMMLEALVERPVSMIGPGINVFVMIVAILALAWALSVSRRHRRRIVVFFITSTAGFVLYYIFHLFLYAFIFKAVEALILKDYLRYISPYWQGWLMASLVLLGLSAVTGRVLRLRMQAARAACLGVSLCLLVAVALRGNPESNFLFYSPSNYGVRREVQAVLADAEEQGMRVGDAVTLLSQGDDGDRSYKFRYEMRPEMTLQYAGRLEDKTEKPVEVDGQPVYVGNVGGTIVPNPVPSTQNVPYPAVGTPEDLAAFLKQEGSTHLLIDRVDNYFLENFAGMFIDDLAGWSDDESLSVGRRYYRVTWEGEQALLVPEEGRRADEA